LAGWEPPPDAALLGAADDFDWDDQLFVSFASSELLSCGDSALQPVYTTFSAEISVENSDIEPGLFPSVHFPETVAVAIWADGASAEMSLLSTDEAAVNGLLPEDGIVVNARSAEQVIVPADSIVTSHMVFELPRDGRFSSVTEYPQSIIIFPPDAQPLWWSVTPGIGASETECLTATGGFVGGPLFESVRP
jgi:hypothetical protein